MVRLAEEGRVLWTQEQARAREPKPVPAPAPKPEPEPTPIAEEPLKASTKPKASAESFEPPRLNANAPVFFTPAYAAPTHVTNTMAAAAPQFTPLNPNFGYAPPMPAQFPMGPAMMSPMMRPAGSHNAGKRSNGRGQRKIGRNRGVGGGGGNGAGRGRKCGGGNGGGEGNIASIVAGLVGKLDAGTVVGTAVGDKTIEGKGATTTAGAQ